MLALRHRRRALLSWQLPVAAWVSKGSLDMQSGAAAQWLNLSWLRDTICRRILHFSTGMHVGNARHLLMHFVDISADV